MDPLSFSYGIGGALAFMFAGWLVYVPIWVISKFSLS